MAAQASELTAIVAFVQGIVAAVPGIVHAYDYQPWALKPVAIPSVMQLDGRIAFWCVLCTSTVEAWVTSNEVELTHTLTIRGYGQLVEPGDVSEPAFQALTGLVADALRTEYTVPGVRKGNLVGPCSFSARAEPRILCETWACHASEGTLRVSERVLIA